MNFPRENLRNPARERRAGAMRQFPTTQLDSIDILREGPRSQGASWAVCGLPEYRHTIFLNLYGVSDSRFSISFP
jgi:hypothetical protein